MQDNRKLDFHLARDRRRFFIERALKRRSPGTGSAILSLMKLPRGELKMSPQELLGDIPFCIVGGVATRAYMPERSTKDVDILVNACDFASAEECLSKTGYTAIRKLDDLFFVNSALGLFGRAWQKADARIDLISSDQDWVHDALMIDSRDQTGLRVIALPYLVLMKMDASRGQDQADIERMLGRLEATAVEDVAKVVTRYLGDPQAAEDVRQYALLGRMEYQRVPEDQEPRTARPLQGGDITRQL